MKLPARLGLLFEWPSRHNIHIVLPFMLVLAFLLHIAGIAAFQILRPRSRPSPERDAQVWFLSPSSPEYARLLPRLEASDPALFSAGRASGRDVWKLPETAYVPSFDAEPPRLEPYPAQKDAAPALPPLARTGPAHTYRPTAKPSPVPGLPTMVKLSGGLSGWTLIPPANAPGFNAQQNKALTPTVFLIALSPDGTPLHVFPDPDRTSGNETLDRAALRHLLTSRYQPPSGVSSPAAVSDSAPNANNLPANQQSTPASDPKNLKEAGTAWGTATFLWGADVKREPVSP